MLVASNNKGKLKEIREILSEYQIKSLKEAGIEVDVVEDADSFYGNAKKKAYEIYDIAHEPVIADDSGICIHALDGFPGVLTHRFLGEGVPESERDEYLIKKLEGKEDRRASFICDIVYYDGEKEIHTQGILDGVIAHERRGANGFGFDEILELPNGLTVAELPEGEKNKISARNIALQKLKKELKKYA